jgi:aspartate carbamoyltransferase catalytic subunit
MGSYSSAYGKEPERFVFSQKKASIDCAADDVQRVINHFKGWLPKANAVYHQRIQKERLQEEEAERQKLEQETKLLRERESVLKKVKL